MKFEKQQKARQLRIEGYSIGSIAKTLGVSKGSISVWVRDINLTPEQLDALGKYKKTCGVKAGNIKRNKFLKIRSEYQEQGKEKIKTASLLYCMGCMLFWAEGSKSKNSIIFTNSDINMIKLFINFLREIGVQNNEISVHINCFLSHEDDIIGVKNYWINELDLIGSRFLKPTIKVTKETVENYGICRISVHNSQLAQQLYGSIQAYGNFSNNMCLDDKRTRKINESD